MTRRERAKAELAIVRRKQRNTRKRINRLHSKLHVRRKECKECGHLIGPFSLNKDIQKKLHKEYSIERKLNRHGWALQEYLVGLTTIEKGFPTAAKGVLDD